MKGNMSAAAFKAWGEQSAADRDSAIEPLETTEDAGTVKSYAQNSLQALAE